MDRLRRALDLISAGAARGAPLSLNVRSIVQQTQTSIRGGLSRCEGSAAALRAKLLLLSRQLRDRIQAQQKPQDGQSRPKSAEELYVALWDRMLRAIGRAAVNHETDDWADYFNGLRNLTRKLVAASTASGLSDDEKATLIRRLLERIDELEHCWLSTNNRPDTKQASSSGDPGRDPGEPEAAEATTGSVVSNNDAFSKAWDGKLTAKPRPVELDLVGPRRDA